MKTTVSILFSFIMLLGCSSQPGQSNEANSEEQAITVPKVFIKRFKGSIDKYPITLSLTRRDSSVSGEYYYDKFRQPIFIKGSMVSDGKISLQEFNDKSEPTGEFSGLLELSGVFKGTWKNLINQKELTFTLNENYDGAARLQLENPVNGKCFAISDPQFKESYSPDSICNLVDITFLKVTTGSTEVSGKINRFITESICDMDFYEKKLNSIDAILNLANDPEGLGFSFWIDCSPVSNENNIFSFRLSQSSYSEGAAHPLTVSHSYNVNITTGNLITLDDILVPGFQDKLNAIAETLFTKEYGSENWNFEAGQFQVKKEFSIGLTGLIFSYDPYEIGYYAMGAPTLVIPYDKIDELIDPNGAIAHLKKSVK